MAVKSHFSEVQIALLLDNKNEYTEHVCDHLSEVLVKVFQEIYDKAYKSPLGRNKGSLEAFQSECEEVISWNTELVSLLFKKIGNPGFSKLLKLVFMTYIKVILAQHGLRLEGRLHVRIPSAEHFVHKCAIEMARSLWKRPYLYYHKVRSLEKQRNLHECDLIARKAIRIVLRQSIPMEQILQEIEINNLSESESEVEKSEDTELETKIETEVEESESESESDTETEEVEAEAESESEEADTEVKAESDTEAEEVEPEIEAEAEPEAETEVEAEVEPEVEPEVEAEVEPEVDAEVEAEVEDSSSTDTNEDIDASNQSSQEKGDSDDDRIHGDSDDDKKVEWYVPLTETIEVKKNEAEEETQLKEHIPPPVELKTTLMGTRHLINPKRLKFVGSGKKDSFF